MTKKEIDTFEKVQSQLESIYEEISLLSKKSQNDALNKFKLGFINKVLEETNKVLKDKYKPFKEFDFFNEEDIPTNSDVVFIISQYFGCLEKLRNDNIEWSGIEGSWIWLSDDNNVYRTKRPKHL